MTCYTRLRQKISNSSLELVNDEIPRIGGSENLVEVDEMAFRRGQLVSNPSNEDENNRETCWIIGGIQRKRLEESDDALQRFFIQIIPNRRAQT